MINARLILAIIQKLHTKWCNKLLGDYLCIPLARRPPNLRSDTEGQLRDWERDPQARYGSW